MNTKATTRDLQRLAQRYGATLEEDNGLRDMRVFQIVAPRGFRWLDGAICLRIDWQTGSGGDADRFNSESLRDAETRLRGGMEAIPESESYLYPED